MIRNVGVLNSNAVRSSFSKATPKAKEQEQGVQDKVSLGYRGYSARHKLKSFMKGAKTAVLRIGGAVAGAFAGAAAGTAGGAIAAVTLGVSGAVSGFLAGGIYGASKHEGLGGLGAAFGYGVIGASVGAAAGAATGIASAAAVPIIGGITGAVAGGIGGLMLDRVKISMS